MSTPGRLLVLTPSFPRHVDDHAGRFVAEHAAALAARGLAVRVLSPAAGDFAPPGVERLRCPSVPGVLDGHGAPEALTARPLRAGLAGLGTTASMAAAAAAHLEPDEALIGHWLLPGGPTAALARRRHPGATLLYAHGGDIALLERLPAGRALARRLDATPIVFVSEALRARFEARLGRPAAARHAVLPMGVAPAAIDGDFATTLRARAAGRRIVTTVGRMVPIKGLDVLLAALRGRRDVVWFAAGDGPERAKLQAANDGVCTPLGPLSPAQRDALLAVSSVFAQPSRPLGRRTEGTPVALLEALRSGVPVVASATGGVPAVATKAKALLVPPDDPAALRAALDAVLDQPARAAEMAAAHRQVGAAYEWPRLGDAHLARLTAAAASPPKSRRTARWV